MNAENYIVPKGEESQYHAIVEIKQFNPSDGSRVSKPRIQKFGAKWFESGQGLALLKQQGYDVVVLHNPTEYLKANAEKLAENKAQKAKEAQEAKAEAERQKAEADKAERQKEIDDAVAKAVAAALASQKPSATKTETAKPSAKDADKI